MDTDRKPVSSELPLVALILSAMVLGACATSADDAASPPPTTITSPTSSAAPSTTTTTEITAATTTTTTTPTTTSTTTTTTLLPATIAPDEIPDRSLPVSAGAAPTIDGVIDAGEWDQATVVALSNGDDSYWQHDEDALYVALDGAELGAVNLVIATETELWILHSSAALGSSLFLPGESAWEQSHGYTWCCRNANDDSARLSLLESEGWQANIGFTGDVGVVEYEVAIPWGFAMAALVYHTEERDSAYWPADLDAEAADHIVNNRWTEPTLDPGEWWMLVPVGAIE